MGMSGDFAVGSRKATMVRLGAILFGSAAHERQIFSHGATSGTEFQRVMRGYGHGSKPQQRMAESSTGCSASGCSSTSG
jgi:hypothetical protein